MKRFLLLLSIATLGLALTACQDEEVPVHEVEKTPSGDQFDFPGNFTIPELDVDGIDDED
jgi:hypothetical protein